MVVAVAQIEIMVSESRSLKTKRRVVRRILDRVRAKFPVSASEVGGQDLWQRADLGFACVSGDRAHAEEVIQSVVRFIEDLYLAPVLSRHVEILRVAEDPDSLWRDWADA